MVDEKYDCYFIKQKDGTLFKFCYDSEQGICYQILMKQNWSDKKSIYKESLKYFYVLGECNGKIHVFCQDICGDIILCTLEGTKWGYKILLHMKSDAIMPVYIRAFFHSENIHLLYNIVDQHTYSEVLVYQAFKNGIEWSLPQIITKLDYYYKVPYCIYQDSKANLILLNTVLTGVYKLTSRNFYIIEGIWGKEEVIHTSLLPYIDFTFCVGENRNHYLFITQDNQVNTVIYQYKEIELQKNIILFQNEKIDSCLLTSFDNILWALWICNDKLYGCFSTNCGQTFSSPMVYKHFDNGLPIKLFYQEYLEDNQNKYYCHETYAISLNGEEQIFLQELLQNPKIVQVNNKDGLKVNAENSKNDVDELKDCFTKVKILTREKKELKENLKIAEEELRRVNDTIKYEKNQLVKLQYEFYKEKEKNGSLEKKLLLKDKEKTLIERKLSEKEKENESLKQQIDVMMVQNLSNSEKFMRESTNERSKEIKFRFVKWPFDDEN